MEENNVYSSVSDILEKGLATVMPLPSIKDEDCAVIVDDVTVRFNKSSENIDNLKEYFVKLVRHELMFQEFLALQHVNLKIKKGEAWGIIGTNGSGKSTLLKCISRILKPYKGTVTVNGTIASLIELGAGIDHRLTARENIYLNGCILGYDKEFIDSKFDEIVEFSELYDFLDTPVKNFSSGMISRLGFSVATIVQPDILIVDEVLSVGDVLFTKKCMNKMDEMLRNGATLLFVSHDLESVRSMCDKAIWIDNGHVIMQGDIDVIANAYSTQIEGIKQRQDIERRNQEREMQEEAARIAEMKKNRHNQ